MDTVMEAEYSKVTGNIIWTLDLRSAAMLMNAIAVAIAANAFTTNQIVALSHFTIANLSLDIPLE